MNHLIHHRARSALYFRLLNIAVPGLTVPAPINIGGTAGAANNDRKKN